MKNKLFIVCPFSSVETFIRSRFGNDVLLLTFSGAVLQFQDIDFVEAVKGMIVREDVDTIYFVNETSCRLINGVIGGNEPVGLHSEKTIRRIYNDHYQVAFRGRSLFQQQVKLAELNVKAQMDKIVHSPMFDYPVSAYNITVKGLIISKERDMVVEISSKKKSNKIYEF